MAQDGSRRHVVIDTPAEFTNEDYGLMKRVVKDKNGSGNGKNVDKERVGSKSVAVERNTC